MVMVIFFEKPGCINGARQKSLLRKAGHNLDVRNLLEEPWTAETLRPFFGRLPVSAWFNVTAPRIKSGEVDPEVLDEKQALDLMISDPVLIRRPLMQVGDQRRVGFDIAEVDAWIGLGSFDHEQDVESCVRAAGE